MYSHTLIFLSHMNICAFILDDKSLKINSYVESSPKIMENNEADLPDHQDVLEENFGEGHNAQNDEAGAGEGNPNHPGDEIDNNPGDPGPAAEPAAAPLPDEIDAMENAIANVIMPPVIDFHQLDNALQHVQGHMDNMMQNLGGLQSSVKHLKHNLNQFCANQKSHEHERNALRLNLHIDIIQSWKEGAFSDLTLVDDAGCQHKVHKVVLASRSPYFRAQLTNWDKDEKVLKVNIVSSDILKIIIEFIYTLDVTKQINNNNVVDHTAKNDDDDLVDDDEGVEYEDDFEVQPASVSLLAGSPSPAPSLLLHLHTQEQLQEELGYRMVRILMIMIFLKIMVSHSEKYVVSTR